MSEELIRFRWRYTNCSNSHEAWGFPCYAYGRRCVVARRDVIKTHHWFLFDYSTGIRLLGGPWMRSDTALNAYRYPYDIAAALLLQKEINVPTERDEAIWGLARLRG